MRSNEKEIIDTLETESANVLKAANALVELMTNFDDLDERKGRIKDFEHVGDKITLHVYMELY